MSIAVVFESHLQFSIEVQNDRVSILEIHDRVGTVFATLHLTVDDTGVLTVSVDVVNLSVVGSLGHGRIQDVINVNWSIRVSTDTCPTMVQSNREQEPSLLTGHDVQETLTAGCGDGYFFFERYIGLDRGLELLRAGLSQLHRMGILPPFIA